MVGLLTIKKKEKDDKIRFKTNTKNKINIIIGVIT